MSRYDKKMRELHAEWVYEGGAKFTDRYLPPRRIEVTEDDIKKIEAEIGHPLPENYVDFLIHYGGSAIRDGNAIIQTLEPEKGLSEVASEIFFGYMPGYGYDLLEDGWRVYKDEEQLRMPRSFLPIATDYGGNMFCLSLFGENEGKVYFWECQLEEMPKPGEEPGYSNVTLLAHSFDEFIESLTFRPHP
ncbi:MAG: SMI1/KNR4 family protein [Thermostichus sp. HHBFW_bins_43]